MEAVILCDDRLENLVNRERDSEIKILLRQAFGSCNGQSELSPRGLLKVVAVKINLSRLTPMF